MKKSKVTRNLMAAVSIVALSAVMYGCTHSGDDGPTAAELAAEQERADAAEQAQMDLDAAVKAVEAARMAVDGVSADTSTAEEVAAARTKVTEAQAAVMKLPEGNDLHASIAGIASDLAGIEMAQANAANEQTRAMQFETVNAALGMAQTAVDGLHQAGSTDAEIASARTLVTAAQDALDAATALTDEQRMSLAGMISALGTTLMGIDEYRASDVGQLAVATAAVEAAQMLIDAVDDDSTPAEVGAAHAALQRAKQALAAAQNLSDNLRASLQSQIDMLTSQLGDTNTAAMNLRDAQDAINAARAAVDALGDDAASEAAEAANSLVGTARAALANLTDEDAARLEGQVAALESEVAGIQSDIANQDMVAANTKAAETKETAIGKEAKQPSDASLGGTARTDADGETSSDDATDDVYSLTIKRPSSGTKIEIKDPANAGDDDPKFTQAMDLGGGTTMHVRTMEADDDGNVESEVVVVSTDIEAPKQVAFAKFRNAAGELSQGLNARKDDGQPGDQNNPDNARDLGGALGSDDPAQAATLELVKSAAFVRAGTENVITFSIDNTVTEDKDEASEVPGTYNGAMGTYRCAGTTQCTVTLDDEDMITAMTDGWVFIPDEGATSDQPDYDFLHYGFWLKKTKDEDGAVSYDEVETFAGSEIDASEPSGLDSIQGGATYSGGATGVYVHSVINTEGTRDSATSGHFTAAVNLTAIFANKPVSATDSRGTIADNMLNTVSGTISNFALSGGEENAWVVNVQATRDSGTNTFDGTAKGGSGDGSIDGTFYGLTPYTEATDDGENRVAPGSMAGEFNAGFTNGSVAGAFGARKDDE